MVGTFVQFPKAPIMCQVVLGDLEYGLRYCCCSQAAHSLTAEAGV